MSYALCQNILKSNMTAWKNYISQLMRKLPILFLSMQKKKA